MRRRGHKKIHKDGWMGDIISPHSFMKTNYLISRARSSFHSDNCVIMHLAKGRNIIREVDFGIQSREYKANQNSSSFHYPDLIGGD